MIDRLRLLRAGIWALTAPLPKAPRKRLRRELRAGLDNRRAMAADFVVLSRAKSGRTWLRAMLSRLYQRRLNLPERVLLEYDNFRRLAPAAPVVAFTHGHRLDALASDPRRGPRLRARPVVLLIRDPRDIAVSEYFQSTRRATEYKRELYEVERADSMFDFLMRSPLGLPAICDYLNRWHHALADFERAHRIRYESLRADPQTEMAALCAFLGTDFTGEEIADAVEFASFESLKRKEREDFFRNRRLRAKDVEDPDSFKVRRGKVGGWRDYFDAERAARIDAFVNERLDPDLGYRSA